MATIKIADVRHKSAFRSTQTLKIFKPSPHQEQSLHKMLDEVIAWAEAMKTVRVKTQIKAASEIAAPSFEEI